MIELLAYLDIANLSADDVYAYHAPEESLDVHVHGDDGYWHRKAVGGEVQACNGVKIHHGAARRYERYEKPLCPNGCFTPYELALAVDHPDCK